MTDYLENHTVDRVRHTGGEELTFALIAGWEITELSEACRIQIILSRDNAPQRQRRQLDGHGICTFGALFA